MTEKNLNKKSNRDDNNALRLKNISKIYPGTIALKNINMDIEKGKVHGIIGKNGAGKSTLIGIIAGIIVPTRGEIFIRDKKYNALSRIEAKNKKISIVTQEPEIIPDCTIAENLFLPDYICRGKIIDWKKLYFEAEKIMKRAGFINIDVKKKAGDFSISERQILLVLKACYIESADIIIMDEVSTSLSQDDEKQLYKIIEERKKEGKTIIFISHRMDEILKICDEVSVIRNGELICTKGCDKLNKHELSSLIVGKDFHFEDFKKEENVRRDNIKVQKIVFSVKKLTKYLLYKNISFDLKEGEILGIAGLRGSGRTEILKGIAGIDPADEGYIKIGNQKKRFAQPSQAFENRIVYLTEDRDKEGLVSSLTIKENLTINVLQKITNIIAINRKKEDKLVTNLINLLEIKTA
ncbi:MAG: sugar ABC transporter ATP-binding protein, partial [Actinomycetia bacterium]|nr:sugar ABC transporter ATP-binding protein [Actinomycetes bacterium]